MAKTEMKLSAIPDKMVNKGDCRSKILVSVREKDKPRSKAWVYVGATEGRLYPLENKHAEEVDSQEISLLKIRTDNGGQATLGLDLPRMLGTVALACGKKRGEVKEVLSSVEAGGFSSREEMATATIELETDKPAEMVLETDNEEVVADGVSALTVSALVTDRYGNPISGQEISFSTTRGVIDPESINSITDEGGRAYASISSQDVGTATIKAVNRYKSWIEDLLPGLEKGDEEEDAGATAPISGIAGGKETLTAEKQVRFVPSYASNLVLGVDNSVVAADGRSEACVTAQLKDEFGNPVDGQVVVFESDLGEIKPDGEVATDSEGRAVALLSSTKVGSASVRVRVEGEENLLSATEVTFEAASPSQITITAESEECPADGETEAVITVEVADDMGNPVPARTVVFRSDLGSVMPDETQSTDKDGMAQVSVVSRAAGSASVTATSGEASAEIQIRFVAGAAGSIAISLNPTVEETWRSRISADHWNRLKEALAHLEERRFSEAIEILEEEREAALETSDYPALGNLAFAYQQSGRKEEAREIFEQIIQRNGSRREILVKADGLEEAFGVVLPETNGTDPGGAENHLKIEPRDYLINVVVTDSQGNQTPDLDLQFEANFGWIPDEYRTGKTNSVGAATSIVTTFAPPGSSEIEFAWVNLGVMKEHSLDYAGAEECYRSAIKATPDSTRGLESLATVLVKTGNAKEAKKCYYNLARVNSRRGRYSKALEFYGKAIELDPKYSKALAGYGTACLRVGELDRGRRYLEESVKLDKSLKAAMANLGLAYYLKGDFERAIQMNRRALKLDSGFRTALLNLHQIHMAMGERDKAREYADRARVSGA